ncbi:hypothetical protein Ahy_A03g012050 [Arachis hypogaea]|uniref:Uncharacterized protein n=1 Tax=Arachis hypogaea TaxID=3818 RepID=A0A445DSF4_ARAHY|nr:hypothetical protein Ahy_A03g012050 [Arachis hypogaea]
MTPDCLFSQGSPKDDPTNEFEIEQQYENKEKVIMAVKMYSIKRVIEYKILKSGQLKYNGPHTYIQISMGQDHGRLDLKIIAQHIFTMVKIDPTINIRVLQGGVDNHFGYKASYTMV